MRRSGERKIRERKRRRLQRINFEGEIKLKKNVKCQRRRKTETSVIHGGERGQSQNYLKEKMKEWKEYEVLYMGGGGRRAKTSKR